MENKSDKVQNTATSAVDLQDQQPPLIRNLSVDIDKLLSDEDENIEKVSEKQVTEINVELIDDSVEKDSSTEFVSQNNQIQTSSLVPLS